MKLKAINEQHMKEFKREITTLANIDPHRNLV